MSAENTEKILLRKDGRIGHLVFNNPERHNAVSLEMWDRVAEGLEDFRNDDELRVVVLSGAGGKAFMSGADISKFESERGSRELRPLTFAFDSRRGGRVGRRWRSRSPAVGFAPAWRASACCGRLPIWSYSATFAMSHR